MIVKGILQYAESKSSLSVLANHVSSGRFEKLFDPNLRHSMPVSHQTCKFKMELNSQILQNNCPWSNVTVLYTLLSHL